LKAILDITQVLCEGAYILQSFFIREGSRWCISEGDNVSLSYNRW